MADKNWRVSYAVLAAAALACIGLLALPYWFDWQDQKAVARFDQEIAARAPAIWSVVKADPVLHRKILTQAMECFLLSSDKNAVLA